MCVVWELLRQGEGDGGVPRGEQRYVHILQSPDGIFAQTEEAVRPENLIAEFLAVSSALNLVCDLGLLTLLSGPSVISSDT